MKGFGSYSIDCRVGQLVYFEDCCLSQIVHIDRLQAISTVTENAEDREVSQGPCNIVDQDILFAKEHGRSQDAVGQPDRSEVVSHFGFTTEIRKIRAAVGIGDADVYDARDPG